jgi:CHASE2 domain-containing sensor protein
MSDWLQTPLGWLFARRPQWRDAAGRWLLRIGYRYYWLLALVFAVAGAWDQFGHPFDRELSHASFDWLMRHRPVPYRADPDIVVLDIDEASLADMSPQFGRWPWPRSVLAEVAAKLEAAGAQAVMFDILFADPDIANPRSEAEFDRYVASSRVSFFPVVRLNPANDTASRISVSMLNFAARDPASAAADANAGRTVALLPPYFKSIYDSTRSGTNNIYPDEDNVVRWYPNFETLAGYRIPSLPYRMAQALGWPLPTQARNLLNWPRRADAYRSVGFAAAEHAASSHDDAFFRQFSGKVVLIGSTAPSLNDIKATPVERMHPGIYVLATAIDNTRNGAFLHPLSAGWIWGLEVLMLAASALLFARTNRALTVAKYFFILPGALLLISLASVSVSTLLLDLSVPAAIMLGYFTFAKLFDSHCRSFISGTGPFAPRIEPSGDAGRLQIAVLPATLSRDEVLLRLLEPGPPIKLWEPADTGLGRRWAEQGWVLWRWIAAGDRSGDRQARMADPRWIDLPANETLPGSFTLARAIAAAATQGE